MKEKKEYYPNGISRRRRRKRGKQMEGATVNL